jgi:phosphopentomutase
MPGPNTLGHIAQACAEGRADIGRRGRWRCRTSTGWGWGRRCGWPRVRRCRGFRREPRGLWGAATEVSRGKDTPSGHWELAGVPVPWDWTYFPDTVPAFPPEIVAEVCRLAGTEGILGNCHASGVPIIAEHCEAHLRTGWPICYTSADSACSRSPRMKRPSGWSGC